ncbi:hypothetical protein Pelo_2770 [Pelomyxa schiedti]|nr:hypothetical protein Pelo_2770 [Pelomyxa schiedti]
MTRRRGTAVCGIADVSRMCVCAGWLHSTGIPLLESPQIYNSPLAMAFSAAQPLVSFTLYSWWWTCLDSLFTIVPQVSAPARWPTAQLTFFPCTQCIERHICSLSFTNTKPKQLNFQEIAGIALGISRGMDSLHGQNYMHRDLASTNILLDANGTPKICYFEGCVPPNSESLTHLTLPLFLVTEQLSTVMYLQELLKEVAPHSLPSC